MSQARPHRSAGLLLHPSSLPGPYGIGDLGPAAYAWVDALRHARQTWWQILPLGPTGFGDSPYQCFSAFAGNPYLISPQILQQDGLLKESDLQGVNFPANKVDYGPVIQFKTKLLQRVSDNFQSGAGGQLRGAFDEFCHREAKWLDDYALFMALKESQGGKSWLQWPIELVQREPGALDKSRKQLARNLQHIKFCQFLFFRQWRNVKQYANSKGLKLIGDVPIFVSSDSADVWANPDFFLLDARRQPTVVAGVPPDYFSPTGQLWGNPLYNWDRIRQTGYAWWIARLKATLDMVDLVRLDHFRGFESYWEVPAGMPTAEHGRWVKGPGDDLFKALQKGLNGLPLIAEDLGLITPEVLALRDRFQLPGMRILQFAFCADADGPFLPHNYNHNTAAYTGTHDNDTTRGWYVSAPPHETDFARRYLARDGNDIAWDFIRLAWSSVADYALAPLQDVLSLGSEARMNFPGKAVGNWSWRYQTTQLNQGLLDRLGELTGLYSR